MTKLRLNRWPRKMNPSAAPLTSNYEQDTVRSTLTSLNSTHRTHTTAAAFWTGNYRYWTAIFDGSRASSLQPQERGARFSLCERSGSTQKDSNAVCNSCVLAKRFSTNSANPNT